MSTMDDKINRKINLVKNILNNVYEVLELFKPLLEKMLKMEEAEQYKNNGSFKKAASLFGDISFLCKEIEGESLTLDLPFDNLAN